MYIKHHVKNFIALKKAKPEMRGIIKALNSIDINVIDSSIGNASKTLKYYLDLETRDNLKYFKRPEKLENELRSKINFYPYVKICKESSKKSSLPLFFKLLDEFYKNRNIDYKHRLVMAGNSRYYTNLRPMSGDVAVLEEDNDKVQKLKNLYIKEFQDFAEFINSKYNK